MIKVCSLAVSLLALLGAAQAQAQERPIVVELFTSEGCSSCPPADALLAELARRKDVLALSFHVDYWDRLGWKDPFSSHQATERQQRYADLFRLRSVYTPQMVVDGRREAVGSDRSAVESALAAASRTRGGAPAALAPDGNRVRIRLGPADAAASGSVLLIGFDRRHASAVERGENSGRTLAHVDVVRSIDEVGRFDGKAAEIEVPLSRQSDKVAVLVQAADGHIVGAAVADAPR